MGLVTEYPIGFLALCILLGAGYATALYYLDIRRGLKHNTHRAMVAFRFVSVTLIAFLLLGPLFRKTDRTVEKPLVIMGIDNSRSMILSADSSFCRRELPKAIADLKSAMEKKCEVKLCSFGDQFTMGLKGDFGDPKTDMATFFSEVTNRYSNRNAAAIILASDGIYNEGTDPYYAAGKIPYPIYTIALGDTMLKKDLVIKKVLVNKIAYKGDKFPVEALVEMNKYAGATARVTLSQGGRTLETREVRAGSDRAIQKITFLVEAKNSGIAKYAVYVSEAEGENNKSNNYADFIVEVLDARQRIGLVYHAPHPDVFAIRKGLESSSHFETELITLDNLPRTFERFDLVILEQVPSVTNVADLAPLFASRVPLLMLIGSQSDINTLNSLKPGLIINASKASFADANPVINPEFALFSLDKRDISLFNEFPPLQSPFGTYQFSPLTDVLFYQKISNVATRTPLIMFTRAGEKKVGFIAGENIWRWRMTSYIRMNTHEPFDMLIDKIALYLAAKEDKSFFRIDLKNRFSENEPVEIDAEVYNASYELINDPDVSITIRDRENRSFPFVFSRTAKAYTLNAGLFPVGEYTWSASARVGSNLYQKTGRFFVEQLNIESANLVADHNLLYRMAVSHDGEMTGKEGISQLAEKILSREDFRPVAIYQQRMSDLIGNPWLFALILLLLAAEWILRKREGI